MTPTTRHPRLPAERFYWAVLTPDLPAASLRAVGSPLTRAVLDEAFAAHLPVGVDRVACAYAALPDGRVLACGLPASQLEHDDLRHAITLTPTACPDWLDQPADAGVLNVLTGPYEPAAVTAARGRRSLVLTAAVALIASGVGVGFERRAAAARADRVAAEAAVARLLTSPAATRANLGGDLATADLALERELSRLRATRSRQASAGLTDASDPLAALLARWPRDLAAQAQALSAAPGQLSVGVKLPAHADAEKLAAALGATPGWEASQPQVSANGRGVQVQLTLKPKGGKP